MPTQSSDALRQQITDTRMRIAQLTNETATAGEIESLEKRSTALEEAQQQAEAIAAAERLAEIEREHAEQLTQAELLMTNIAKASAAIVQALADLKPLIRQASQLEHEREYLSLRYTLHSSPLPKLPTPDTDFLAGLEKARLALRATSTDDWERRTRELKEAAQRQALEPKEGTEE
jgi:hypothetical protein